MEISLSPELMVLLEKLISVFSKVQLQYLIVIIPTAVIFLLIFVPNAKPIYLRLRRKWLRRQLEKTRGSSVVSLIHKAGGGGIFSLFTVPFISLDDSQKLLRALKEIPSYIPVDLILHTPGGLVIAAEQIAQAIKARKGTVRAFIPQYAMSGGTLIALACDSIHMGDNALLGPLDPQLGIGLFEMYPAASIIKALECDNPNRDDKTLILADISKKAIAQMQNTVTEILEDKLGKTKAEALANKLCTGNWTHDYSIDSRKALELGIAVDNNIPEGIFKFINTYPCSSSVSYRKKKDKDDGRIRIYL